MEHSGGFAGSVVGQAAASDLPSTHEMQTAGNLAWGQRNVWAHRCEVGVGGAAVVLGLLWCTWAGPNGPLTE